MATFDINVVHVAFDRLADLWAEDLIHCPLISSPCVLQAEGHDCVTIYSEWRSEGCVLFIIRVHFYLIVSRESIHERHAFEPTCIINHDIGNWQRELVFWAGVVKVPKVNAYSDLAVLFSYRDDVGHTVWMLFFPDNARVNQILDFDLDVFHRGR